MSTELVLPIAIGGALLAALGAILWMMFHGRQFLPDAVREEFRESQRQRNRRFRELLRDSKFRRLLILPAVVAVSSSLARSEFWIAPTWKAALGVFVSIAMATFFYGLLLLAGRKQE